MAVLGVGTVWVSAREELVGAIMVQVAEIGLDKSTEA